MVSGVFWPGVSIHRRRGWFPQRVERPSIDCVGGADPLVNQETFVKLEDLRKLGWTVKEIAAETGYHPATISKWLECGPPVGRTVPEESRVTTARWAERVAALVGAYPRLLGISVWRCLRAEGFEGCYSTVTGELCRRP